jgi:hypothetical protein
MMKHSNLNQKFRILSNMTSPRRLRLLGVAFLAIWTISYVYYHVSDPRLVRDKEILYGRDFMAFYIAGMMIRENNGANLYRPAYQQHAQDRILHPEKTKGLNYYINPAPVAVVCSAFTVLPYRTAFHLHTVLMIFFFAAGVCILKPHLDSLSSNWWIAGLIGLVWFPTMHTVTGGQNAALNLLLMAWAYAATVQGRQAKAGLAVGLLLFKPQYALPLLGLLFLRKKWITVGTAGLVGAGQYLLGAYYCGWDWPHKMMGSALAGFYQAHERVFNGHMHVSIVEVIDYSIIQPLEKFGVHGIFLKIPLALSYGMVSFIILYLIWLWRRADADRNDFGLYWSLAVSGTLLISPHTQYYDVAILFLPVLLLLNYQLARRDAVTSRQKLILIGVFWIFPFHVFSPLFRFQPLIFIPLGIFWWTAKMIAQEKNRSAILRPGYHAEGGGS